MSHPHPQATPRNGLGIPSPSKTAAGSADSTSNSAGEDSNSGQDSPQRSEAERIRLIREHTLITCVPLIPDLKLHLITEHSPLWLASEEQAREAGFDMPFWAFAWPGGQALARHLLDNPELVRGKRVLDFGSGSAIEALAALKAGAAQVVAADIDPFACTAANLNAQLNELSGLDTTSENLVGQPVEFDLLLAGDVFYDPDFAQHCLKWLQDLAKQGTTILIGDPSRGFLDISSLRQLAKYSASHDGELDPEKIRETWVYSLDPEAS